VCRLHAFHAPIPLPTTPLNSAKGQSQLSLLAGATSAYRAVEI
jgi:hypothetical protein